MTRTIRSIRRGAAAFAALGLTAAVAAPTAAQAGTVTTGPDGAIVVTAGPERNRIGLQTHGSGDGRIVVYDGVPGTTVTSQTPLCEQWEEDGVICPAIPAAGIRIDLGDGDDDGYLSSGIPTDARVSFSGGAGSDTLAGNWDSGPLTFDGGPGDDRVTGGPAADTLLGGDGNDAIDGGIGGDRLDGGAGDDLLSGDGNKGKFADAIDGGAGRDTIESDWSDEIARTEAVNVTLGGGADDGRPGEGDDVRNVESITTHQSSALVGTDAAEHLETFQTLGAATLTGNGGDDTLKGGGGNDRLDGGAGADTLDAGFGDDTIVGGPGRDAIHGDRRGGDCGPLWCTMPYGNDTIDARDGEVDSITCGAGSDRVVADADDVVAPDCETVERDGRGGGGGQTGPDPKPNQRRASARRACVVPAVQGLAVRAAKTRLTRAGCKPAVRYARSAKVKRGKVVKASAKRGTRLARDARVVLTVSRGR